MIEKIAQFAINRPASMIVLVATIIILGFLNLSKLPIDFLPKMDLPVAAVVTGYPGAGPEEVEEQVTKVLEGVLGSVSGIDTISSTSSSGSSMIIIMFDFGTNMDSAMNNIRDQVGRVERRLPDGATRPTVVKMDPNTMPVIRFTIDSDLSLAELQQLTKDEIEPRLLRLPQVASVTITGGRQKEVKVEVDPVKAENLGLSLNQIASYLRSENYSASSGSISYGERRYFVRSLQEFESLNDIGEVAIFTGAGNRVFLKDIAEISEGYKDVTQITRTGGKDALGIHCQKETDANTVDACTAIKKEIERIKSELAVDLEIKVVMDQSEYIQRSLNSTARTMGLGAVFAVLVILVFLRNIRSTVVIFTAIPLSIIATFILLFYTGSTLNIITLGGLALGIGRMVDDSIVVFENIYRHRTLGLSLNEAAVKGTTEVGGAVLATTLTLLAVFVPIGMTEGLAGIIFKPMAMTLCVAILCSLLVALTIVPFLSSRVLTDKAMEKRISGTGTLRKTAGRLGDKLDNLGNSYKNLIKWSLKRRRLVIFVVAALMALSLVAVPFIGAEFMPASDPGQISVSVEADKGTLINDMEKIIIQIEDILLANPNVDVVFANIGSSGRMAVGSSVNQASVSLKLVPKNMRQDSAQHIADDIRNSLAGISGVKITVGTDSGMYGGMGSGGAINIAVQGNDLNVLKDITSQVESIVRRVPGTREVASSLTSGDPEVQIRINRRRAVDYGLTPAQITSEIRSAVDGVVATTYRSDGNDLDVRVFSGNNRAQTLESLAGLKILTSQGTLVDLKDLATFELSRGPVQINRVDQVRQATITGQLFNRDLNSVMREIQSELKEIPLPGGYDIKFGGEGRSMAESFSSLFVALLLAILLVYVVMVVQYESFSDPFVIMLSMPTAIIGVILALLIAGMSFSVNAFIGIIMLSGIVVSNGIILIDYLKKLREAGMDRDEAIIEAGGTRLRPILMTALTTVLAMVPMSLGLGEGGETNAPLATVVIGGLLVSTFITLILMPVVYSIFDDWIQKYVNKKRFPEETIISGS